MHCQIPLQYIQYWVKLASPGEKIPRSWAYSHCSNSAYTPAILSSPRNEQQGDERNLAKYICKRLLQMIPVLLGVALIVFTLMYITPSNPANMILGDTATPEQVAALEEELGLNDPFLVQFGNYILGIVTRFDFGTSWFTGKPIVGELLLRFPKTALLAALSVVLSAIIGIVCGVVAATKQYSIFDNLATAISLVGVSMPSFWLALMLCLLFAVKLGWLPVSGSYGWEYWVLPVVTLGTSGAANIMRMTRSSMLEVIRMDYIRTARAKGQSERMVITRHALKNALIPVITVIGIQFGNLLGGSVLVESVFAIPGLGKYGVDAIKQRDLPAVLGSVLFLAVTFSFVNLLTDILYSFIDPRIQTSLGPSRRQKRAAAGKAEEGAA